MKCLADALIEMMNDSDGHNPEPASATEDSEDSEDVYVNGVQATLVAVHLPIR